MTLLLRCFFLLDLGENFTVRKKSALNSIRVIHLPHFLPSASRLILVTENSRSKNTLRAPTFYWDIHNLSVTRWKAFLEEKWYRRRSAMYKYFPPKKNCSRQNCGNCHWRHRAVIHVARCHTHSARRWRSQTFHFAFGLFSIKSEFMI